MKNKPDLSIVIKETEEIYNRYPNDCIEKQKIEKQLIEMRKKCSGKK